MRYENILLGIAIAALVAIAFLSFFYKSNNKGRFQKITLGIWTGLCLCIWIPTGALIVYLIERRMEFTYVYEHVDSNIPLCYRISALWAGQQGSLLLWSSILALGGFVVLFYGRRYTQKILGTYSLATLFVALLAFLTNGFKLMQTVPKDGVGLSISLQDPWMVIHPPLVFIGYTGMGILFCLMFIKEEGKIIKLWMRVSEFFLGLGILTGSVWAYRCLGWGGFWSWDAIENIALVPWLLICAFLHGKISLSKGMIVLPFSLAVFGTFLTRSGILNDTSVHAYTNGSSQSAFYVFLALLLGCLSITVILIVKYREKVHAIKWRDTMQLFRLATYLYCTVIFAATICPILTKTATSIGFYRFVSTLYLLIMIVLISLYHNWFTRYVLLGVLPVSMLLILGVVFSFPNIRTTILVLFWLCSLPLLGYCYFFVRKKNKYYVGSHILLLIFLLGIISASGFSAKYMGEMEYESSELLIQGKTYDIGKLQEGKTMLVSDILSDYVITETQTSAANKSLGIVFYESKPLICLLWFGGFGLLGSLLIGIHKK